MNAQPEEKPKYKKEATEILESRIAVIKNNYPEIADYRQALELGAKALEK